MNALRIDVNAAIAAELRAQCALRSLSGAEIARRLDVDPLWVTRRLSATTPCTVSDLFLLCSAIGAWPLDVIAEVEGRTEGGYGEIYGQSDVDTEPLFDVDHVDPDPREAAQQRFTEKGE